MLAFSYRLKTNPHKDSATTNCNKDMGDLTLIKLELAVVLFGVYLYSTTEL